MASHAVGDAGHTVRSNSQWQRSDSSADAEQKAATASADANVKRLDELEKFKTIYAPFDGVITARNTDIGALIGPEIAARGAAAGGVTWHLARPPVQGLEFEMDVRGAAREIVI